MVPLYLLETMLLRVVMISLQQTDRQKTLHERANSPPINMHTAVTLARLDRKPDQESHRARGRGGDRVLSCSNVYVLVSESILYGTAVHCRLGSYTVAYLECTKGT